ncbi:MAG: oligosaccharide flippase family protein [Synechococcus sp.]
MSSNSTLKTVAGSSLWLTARFALAKSSQLMSQIVLARLLTPEVFGIWGMVWVVMSLANLFKDKALAQVLVHRGLADKTLTEAVYSLGVTVSVVMFVIQSGIGYLMAIFFDEPIVFPLTAFSALVFLFSAGEGAHEAVLSRRMQFREQAIAESCGAFARMGGAIGGAVFGLGVWSFGIAEIARAIVVSGLKRWFSRYRFRYRLLPDRAAVRNVRGYISSLVGTNLAVYANTSGDDVIIGRLLGAQPLGFYNMAYQLSMLPAYALSQINRVNFSVIAQSEVDGQKRYIEKVLELSALISAPIYGIGFVVAPWLIPLIFGMNWSPVVPLFQILLIFAYSRGFMSILGTSLNALEKPHVNAAINWVLVPISIPVFLLGAWLGGLVGVAISVTTVMGVVATIWFWLATSKVLNYSISSLIRPVVLPSGSAFVSVVAALAVPSILNPVMSLIDSDLWPIVLKALQPVVLVAIYSLSIFIGSSGQTPHMLLKLIKTVMRRESSENYSTEPRLIRQSED